MKEQKLSKNHQKAIGWLDDYETCNQHLQSKVAYDIRKLLKTNGGLVRIEKFLPTHVADYALSIIESIPDQSWFPTAADENYKHNNIAHSFLSVKEQQAPQLSPLLRLFTLLLPEQFQAFSAAKYGNTDMIAPHDDRAYTPIYDVETEKIITCSRDIACIYYLTKNWTADMGGVLIDCVDKKSYVPLFNSMVVFQVPRYHEVTAVRSERYRYSIFGWFLLPGKTYDLYSGAGGDAEKKKEKDSVGQPQSAKQKRNKYDYQQEGKEEEERDDEVIEPTQCKLAQRLLQIENQRQQHTEREEAKRNDTDKKQRPNGKKKKKPN